MMDDQDHDPNGKVPSSPTPAPGRKSRQRSTLTLNPRPYSTLDTTLKQSSQQLFPTQPHTTYSSVYPFSTQSLQQPTGSRPTLQHPLDVANVSMFSSPGSGSSLWQAQLKIRPSSMLMLPFATRGYRDPDAIQTFHHYELEVPAGLMMNMRIACVKKTHSEMHIGLVALQILLAHLTGAEDIVIGIGRTIGNRSEIVLLRLKASPESSFEQALGSTKQRLTKRDSTHKSPSRRC
jgi:hypothetical protein